MGFLYSALSLLGIQALSGLGMGIETHSSLQDWDLSQPMNGITCERVKGVADPMRDVPTMRYSYMKNFKKSDTSSSGGSASRNARRSALASAGFHRRPVLGSPHSSGTTKRAQFNGTGKSYQNITVVGDYSTQYGIQCAWDGTPVWLLFDTGSSDTWAVQSGFHCVDSMGTAHEEVACGFGAPLIDGFGEGRLNELHFYLKYGSDEVVWGPMGYSDISCGGFMVAQQQVGLANHTYWHGNNITVGILGLAYPAITSAYYGAIGDERQFNAVSYTPFLTHAIIQGTIEPMFSVAIRKNSSDGILAWGGLPPLNLVGPQSASTDLIIVSLDKRSSSLKADILLTALQANLINQENTAWQYSFYTIIPDGIKWGQTSNDAKYPYIVDTGTTMMYLPPREFFVPQPSPASLTSSKHHR
jgi:hypothetical protein